MRTSCILHPVPRSRMLLGAGNSVPDGHPTASTTGNESECIVSLVDTEPAASRQSTGFTEASLSSQRPCEPAPKPSTTDPAVGSADSPGACPPCPAPPAGSEAGAQATTTTTTAATISTTMATDAAATTAAGDHESSDRGEGGAAHRPANTPSCRTSKLQLLHKKVSRRRSSISMLYDIQYGATSAANSGAVHSNSPRPAAVGGPPFGRWQQRAACGGSRGTDILPLGDAVVAASAAEAPAVDVAPAAVPAHIASMDSVSIVEPTNSAPCRKNLRLPTSSFPGSITPASDRAAPRPGAAAGSPNAAKPPPHRRHTAATPPPHHRRPTATPRPHRRHTAVTPQPHRHPDFVSGIRQNAVPTMAPLSAVPTMTSSSASSTTVSLSAIQSSSTAGSVTWAEHDKDAHSSRPPAWLEGLSVDAGHDSASPPMPPVVEITVTQASPRRDDGSAFRFRSSRPTTDCVGRPV